jgi:hypothetical protein
MAHELYWEQRSGQKWPIGAFLHNSRTARLHADHATHAVKAFWLRDLVNLTFAKRA